MALDCVECGSRPKYRYTLTDKGDRLVCMSCPKCLYHTDLANSDPTAVMHWDATQKHYSGRTGLIKGEGKQ